MTRIPREATQPMTKAELAEQLKGVAMCGAIEAACVCGERRGHDGPHVCSDHERCNGSWWVDDAGEFRVARMPAAWDATLNWLFGDDEDLTWDALRADVERLNVIPVEDCPSLDAVIVMMRERREHGHERALVPVHCYCWYERDEPLARRAELARDRAVARAEAAEAERDAANALGAETTVQLKSAQYHLGVMVKAWEAAEARIAAALAIPEPEFSDRPFANENGANDSVRGQRSMRDRFRSALAEPVEPQPFACATCNGYGQVCDFWGYTDACMSDRCKNNPRPCPSCAPTESDPT